jgi:hypothetical protein
MKWDKEKIKKWQEKTGWLFGFNYVASTAVNSTEMWQKETYDPENIGRELDIAAGTGYNSCRVFLQFLVWEKERDGFLETFGNFCETAASSGINVMPILFDDCAFAGKEPYLGNQDAPVFGVHNSGWTPSPGPRIADDPSKEDILRAYVSDVVGAFKDNKNIVIWDIYNEPGNSGRAKKSLSLLEKSFAWAREANPVQPLTAGLWTFDEYEEKFAELSDVISYHDYNPLENSRDLLKKVKKYNRPVYCTEWLLRQAGNNFESHLPLYAKETAGAYNWGLILGKTQTNLHWGEKDAYPKIWQHDLYYTDKRPYDENEILFIQKFLGK